METENRELDTRTKVIKVVTANDFITADFMEPEPSNNAMKKKKLSLKARKLLYVAISQCKENDEKFYSYQMTVKQFADMMGIAPSNIYAEVEAIANELAGCWIRIEKDGFFNCPLFMLCGYTQTKKIVTFEINPRMAGLLLDLKGNFTQPLLDNFMHMNSPYSMEIWHLMQREMESSRKLFGSNTITFDLSVAELRKVTGTEDKLKQMVDFKNRVLNKAIREIKENCGTIITYENIKKGRSVVGFRFTAIRDYTEKIDPMEQARIEANAERCRRKSRER